MFKKAMTISTSISNKALPDGLRYALYTRPRIDALKALDFEEVPSIWPGGERSLTLRKPGPTDSIAQAAIMSGFFDEEPSLNIVCGDGEVLHSRHVGAELSVIMKSKLKDIIELLDDGGADADHIGRELSDLSDRCVAETGGEVEHLITFGRNGFMKHGKHRIPHIYNLGVVTMKFTDGYTEITVTKTPQLHRGPVERALSAVKEIATKFWNWLKSQTSFPDLRKK